MSSWYILVYYICRITMEDAGVVKLYKPFPTPCLYVAPVQNMVGRVPLIPVFLAGNSTPTIPHMFAKRKDACFPFGCTDAAAVDGRQGSNVYEVNAWLWSFGRGKPRLGGLSIEQTEARHDAAASEARRKRAAEPKRVRKTAPPDSKYSMMRIVYTVKYCYMQ